MYMTGFADEAAKDIDGQIKATKELGWSNIESRAIDGVNIHDLDDAAFDVVYGKLQDAGISINCFGSTLCNWAKQITDPFDVDLAIAKRAIPRMHKLGTKYIRIMSYAVLKDSTPENQMKEVRFERLRELTKMFLDEGIQPLHENCMNWAGMGWSYTLELLDMVPGLKLVFDTGNPVSLDDCTFPPPYPKQSAWKFFDAVKDHVEYIHIKDGKMVDGGIRYTYPGEGDGDVKKIVKYMIANGYDGGISIEPHLSLVFHDKDSSASADAMYSSYVEYGKRMMSIIADIRKEIAEGK